VESRIGGELAPSAFFQNLVINLSHVTSVHNLFQIADVDSGVIKWVNADLITHVFLWD